MKAPTKFPAIVLSLVLTGSCGDALPEQTGPVDYTYDVVAEYPHDQAAFTQGLSFARENGRALLYESTGLRGRSTLRRVDLKTGQILQKVALADRYFGEGVVILPERIVQLSWQSKRGFVYDRRSLKRIGDFHYATEGWGLTLDPDRSQLIMSDGTARLFRMDPQNFRVRDFIEVRESGRAVLKINELEWVKGQIYANIWQTPWIVMVDPQSGAVVGRMNLSGLYNRAILRARGKRIDVLNGIAYDPEQDRLFVTGKLWPRVFEIRLRKVAGQ